MTALDLLDEVLTEPDLRRPLHRVRRLAGALLIVLLVVALAAWRYQPLTAGDVFGLHGSGVTRLPPGSQVSYAPDAAFNLTLSLRNASRLPVRITAIPAGSLRPALSTFGVRVMPPSSTAYDDARASAFRPFTLRAGQTRVLDVRFTFKACGPPAGDTFRMVRSQPVTYQIVAGLHRSAAVSLLQPAIIVGLPNC